MDIGWLLNRLVYTEQWTFDGELREGYRVTGADVVQKAVDSAEKEGRLMDISGHLHWHPRLQRHYSDRKWQVRRSVVSLRTLNENYGIKECGKILPSRVIRILGARREDVYDSAENLGLPVVRPEPRVVVREQAAENPVVEARPQRERMPRRERMTRRRMIEILTEILNS